MMMIPNDDALRVSMRVCVCVRLVHSNVLFYLEFIEEREIVPIRWPCVCVCVCIPLFCLIFASIVCTVNFIVQLTIICISIPESTNSCCRCSYILDTMQCILHGLDAQVQPFPNEKADSHSSFEWNSFGTTTTTNFSSFLHCAQCIRRCDCAANADDDTTSLSSRWQCGGSTFTTWDRHTELKTESRVHKREHVRCKYFHDNECLRNAFLSVLRSGQSAWFCCSLWHFIFTSHITANDIVEYSISTQSSGWAGWKGLVYGYCALCVLCLAMVDSLSPSPNSFWIIFSSFSACVACSHRHTHIAKIEHGNGANVMNGVRHSDSGVWTFPETKSIIFVLCVVHSVHSAISHTHTPTYSYSYTAQFYVRCALHI